MRKFLVAVSLVSVFAFIADTASARGRIGRVVSSKPAPVKTVPKPEAARAAERPSTPRTWIVATPRPASQPASAPHAAANVSDDESRGRYEASWGAMPSAGSSGPAAATDAPPGEPAAAASAQAESAPQAPSRVVALNTTPSPKSARAAPAQPREVVVCYWNRTGQCVP
jgi:hypothetical protein